MEKYRSWVEIDLKNYTRNLSHIRKIVGSKVKLMAVVKADAYGHGAIEISRSAIENSIEFLGVANAEEGIHLRLAGINHPIIILSPSFINEIPRILKYSLTPAVSTGEFCNELSKMAIEFKKTCPVHIEIDTGMGRSGFPLDRSLIMRIKRISDLKGLSIEGIFSHFPISEKQKDRSCYGQISEFEKLIENLKKNGITFPLVHMANSGAVINYPESYFNLVRVGLLSYGEFPSNSLIGKVNIKPVMSFKTRVLLIKKVKKGESISYGRTYIYKKPSKIAIIPIGYGDGYKFLLSNRGRVLIKGKSYPVVGRVTMDLTMIDISLHSRVKVGDEVVLLGKQDRENITGTELARESHSINYNILCDIGKRAPRVYLKESERVSVYKLKGKESVGDRIIPRKEIDRIIKSWLQVRLNEELGEAIYSGVLESYFGNVKSPLEFRTDFRHTVKMENIRASNFYKVQTEIEYRKFLRFDRIIVGCGNTVTALNQMFTNPLCEYRWLLHKGLKLEPEDFTVSTVRIDGLDLKVSRKKLFKDRMEFTFSHERLKEKCHSIVKFRINTVTKHNRDDFVFPVYIAQPTKGIHIIFDYSGIKCRNMEVYTFFAGKQKYPKITKRAKKVIEVVIKNDTWIFPNSGIIFIWH